MLGDGWETCPLSLPKAQRYLRQMAQPLLPGGEAGGGKSAPGTDPGTCCQQSKYPMAAAGHRQLKHLLYRLRRVSSESLLLLCNGWGRHSKWKEDSKAEGQPDEEIKVLLSSWQLISQSAEKAAEQTSG